MHDPALRSRFAVLTSTPRDIPSPALPSSSERISERLGTDAVVTLAGLGIAAVATIGAFFGIGYLLLAGQPVQIAHSEPSAAVVAKAPSAVAIDPATVSPAVPASEHASSLSPDGQRAAVPIAPAGNIPVPSPVESATPDTTTPGKTIPAPVSPAPAPDLRANGAPVAAAPAPAASLSSRPGDTEASTTAQPVTKAQLPAAEIDALLGQGDDAFRRGDLASARLLYRRAYDANDGRGALGIGASYDPVFLRRYHLWTQYASPEEARIWYLRAHDLGAKDAQNRLKRLNVKSTR